MDNEISKHISRRTKTKLWMDILIFIAFLIAMEPHLSGLEIHEWLTLSMFTAITIHLLLSWDWIADLTRHFLGNLRRQGRINYLLNWFLFIDGTLIMVSGMMISEVALPMIGIHLPEGFGWRRLHDMSASIGLLLLGVHTALHWSWIVNTFTRYIVQPLVHLLPVKSRKDDSL